MAKIALDLNRFKASGVYTVEFDASEQIIISTQTVRLVPGFSRKGPINAPVFLRDIRTARRIFGEIDAFLEKRGSFFHRTIEICLTSGPVYAINLLPLNNVPVSEGGDSTEYRGFALSSDEENGDVRKSLLASFYNKERFWFPDTEYLQATVDNQPVDNGRLLSVVNLSQSPKSVLFRKSKNANQYNITARDYFGLGNVPSYIKPNDFMSDYFLDIYIIEGNWTDLTLLSQDPQYSRYFDSRGLKADSLEQFSSADGITLIGAFTGCLIPDFVDNNGTNQSLETLVNAQVGITGILLNVNQSKLEDYDNSTFRVDTVGHSLINTTDDTIDFLSYNTPIKSILEYAGSVDIRTQAVTIPESVTSIPYVFSYPLGGRSGNFFNAVVIPKPEPGDSGFTIAQYENVLKLASTNSLIWTIAGGLSSYDLFNDEHPNDYLKVSNIIDTGTSIILQLSSPLHEDDTYENGYSAPESNYIESTVADSVPTTSNQIDATFTNLTPATGDIVLVQFAGYSRYFEVSSYSAPTITVDTTPTSGAPYYKDKFCSTSLDISDYSNVVLGSEINVTLYQLGSPAADALIPDLTINTGTTIVYSPDATLNSVDGIRGNTDVALSSNEVTLEVIISANPLAAIPVGTWNINYGSAGPSNTGWSLVPGSDFGSVRIDDGSTVNPFDSANNFTVGDVVKVSFVSGASFYIEVDDISATVAAGVWNGIIPVVNTTYTPQSFLSLAYIEAYPSAKLTNAIRNGLVVNGDKVKYGTGSSSYNYLNVQNSWSYQGSSGSVDESSKVSYGLVGTRVRQYANSTFSVLATTTYAPLNYTYIDATIYTDGDANTNDFAVYSATAKNISKELTILTPGLYAGGKKFQLSSTNATELEVGDFVVDNSATPILTRVIRKIKKIDPVTGAITYEYEVLDTPYVNLLNSSITRFTPIQKFCDRLQFTLLSGFKLTDFHLPNNSDSQLDKIYGVLESTNIGSTLASKDIIQFRYVVDTFNLGLQPHMGPKQYLSRLAKNRQKCMAIINAPSLLEFQNSTDPRFTDLPDPQAGNPKPVLNTDYIATGGNLSLGPSFTWSLPNEENGAKFIGVFTPNVIIREQNKNISIPPAADVSNNFIRKFVNGQPYSIVAGPRRGVLSNSKFIGMEYDYLLRDRENLEPIGLNPITVVRGVGPMIFANQSAYQQTVSAFNNLHVRDLLITIEESIEDVLQNYLFEFNDATTRLEIRTIVENYLSIVRNAGGLSDFDVVMDESNNTPAIIDQNFGIIDVAIEPTRGLQKFINRITVLKTGAISSGGFSAA